MTSIGMVPPLMISEVDIMRKRLFDNISDLNANKYRIRSDEYNQLLNYHHYALTILDNIKIISQSEINDHSNPYDRKPDIIYNRDGRIITPSGKPRFKGEWESQFDENIINPPCYTIPPSNVWGLPPNK